MENPYIKVVKNKSEYAGKKGTKYIVFNLSSLRYMEFDYWEVCQFNDEVFNGNAKMKDAALSLFLQRSCISTQS